jgi:CRISPR-associated protein Csm5
MNNCVIETITPVHIGSGILFQKDIEFLRIGEFLGIIDDKKVLKLIGEEQIGTWVSMIEKGEPLLPYLQKRSKDLDLEDVCSRTMAFFAENVSNCLTLKEQIHTGTGKPYIPGSSIKGAVRTAIFNSLIHKSGSVTEQQLKNRKNYLDDSFISKKLFGKDPNHDSLRFLQITDAIFEQGDTIATNMMSMNHTERSTRLDRKVSQLTEAVGEEVEAPFRISIDHKKLGENIKYKKIFTNVDFLNSLPALFKLINDHTLKLLQEERKVWNDLSNEHAVTEYLEKIEELIALASPCGENEAMLRLGHGSGWNFMTGAWPKDPKIVPDDHLYEQIINRSRPGNQKKYAEYMFPKTRRMDEDGFLLGFVKIKNKNQK